MYPVNLSLLLFLSFHQISVFQINFNLILFNSMPYEFIMISVITNLLIICSLFSLSFRGNDVGANARWRPSQVNCSTTRKLVDLQCNGNLPLQRELLISSPSKVSHFFEMYKDINPRNGSEVRIAIISINFKTSLGITHETVNNISIASYVSVKSSHNFGINDYLLQVEDYLRRRNIIKKFILLVSFNQ